MFERMKMLRMLVMAGATLPCVVAGARGQMAEMEHHAHAPAVRSSSLTVTVEGVAHTLTLAELEAMPQKTVTVKNGHSGAEETYSGPAVSEVLAKCGLAADAQKRILHSYVRAEGTDKYWVLYSAAELGSLLHDGDAIVALTLGGKPLAEDGSMKLVVTGEKKPARWVRNLSGLTVVTLP